MGFLTKNERTLIALISSNDKLSATEKEARIKRIKSNARLRQDKFRAPVKVFFAAMSNYQANKIYSHG